MKFNKISQAAAIKATADMLKEHAELLTKVNNALMDKRTLREGDVVTIHAGLPELKSGEIEGTTREWLAFKATVTRGESNIDFYIGLNSLARGYYADEEDILIAGKNGNIFPDSSKLHRRFGEIVALGQLTENGIEIPFLSDDTTVTMAAVEGYRPVYSSNDGWTVGAKETLIVVK